MKIFSDLYSQTQIQIQTHIRLYKNKRDLALATVGFCQKTKKRLGIFKWASRKTSGQPLRTNLQQVISAPLHENGQNINI